LTIKVNDLPRDLVLAAAISLEAVPAQDGQIVARPEKICRTI
jgi:hypothetical protein